MSVSLELPEGSRIGSSGSFVNPASVYVLQRHPQRPVDVLACIY